MLWRRSNITGNTVTYTHSDANVTEALLFITNHVNSTITFTNCDYEVVCDRTTEPAVYAYMWVYHVYNLKSGSTISCYMSSGTNGYFLVPCSGIDIR